MHTLTPVSLLYSIMYHIVCALKLNENIAIGIAFMCKLFKMTKCDIPKVLSRISKGQIQVQEIVYKRRQLNMTRLKVVNQLKVAYWGKLGLELGLVLGSGL